MKVAVHLRTGHLVTLQELYIMLEVLPLDSMVGYKITAISNNGHVGYVVDSFVGASMFNKDFVEREFEVIGDL